MNLKTVTRGGVIAAMYVVLTVTPGLNAISYNAVQFRISEMLMPLAAFDIAAVPGLWIGLAGLAAPVIFNALGVALIIMLASAPEDGVLFWPTAFTVGLGELGVMVVLAAPLFVMLKRNPEIIGLEQRL